MAAVVLYLVAVGAVKGFAFALGLATVLDLRGGVPVPASDHDDVRQHQGVPLAAGQRPRPRARAAHNDDDDDAAQAARAAREGGLTWPSSGLADPPLPRRGRPQHRRQAQDLVRRRRRSWCWSRSSASCSRLQARHRVHGRQRSSPCRPSVGTLAEVAGRRRRRPAPRSRRRRDRSARGARRSVKTATSSTTGPHLVADPDAGRPRSRPRSPSEFGIPPDRDQRQARSAAAWGGAGHRAGAARPGRLPGAGDDLPGLIRFEWRMAVAAVASLLLEPDPDRRRSTRWSASRSRRRRSSAS